MNVRKTPPLVSVVIPLYESQHTLGRCLEALARQTFRDVEVVLIDSSPHEKCASVARAVWPDAVYFHTDGRLLPQAARNVGAARARGVLLAFTDPDIYPEPAWLERLVASWRAGHPVVLGSIGCAGRRWLDRGAHLCKFNICLPGGVPRSVPLGWSGNVLLERGLFASLGGWDAEHVQGDSVFTARLRASGHDLWFEPGAVVAHDHDGLRWRGFVRERFSRGREFAWLELGGHFDVAPRPAGPSSPRRVRSLALLPARIVRRMIHVGYEADRADLLPDFLVTLPAVLAGVTAWYAGLWAGYCRHPPTLQAPRGFDRRASAPGGGPLAMGQRNRP